MAGQPRSHPEPWLLRPASAAAKKQWDAACAALPEVMAAERERLRTQPTVRSNPRRTHRLRGKLADRKVGEVRLPQWQHEITGAGRVWYCPDADQRIVWITQVSLSHPKQTD